MPSDPDLAPGYIGGDRFGVKGASAQTSSSGFMSPQESASM